MIELTDVPIELTTAATNLPLVLVALAGLAYLYRLRDRDPWKVRVWMANFTCVLVANLLAAGAHGLKLAAQAYAAAWALIDLSLGLTIACLVVGVVLDLWGERWSRRTVPVMTVVALAFVVVSLVIGQFIVFVAYEALFVTFAIAGYGYLVGRLAGAGLVCAGLVISLLAAVVQATRIIPQVTLIWTFDHNGLFHLLQLPGAILIVLGVGAALRAHASAPRAD